MKKTIALLLVLIMVFAMTAWVRGEQTADQLLHQSSLQIKTEQPAGRTRYQHCIFSQHRPTMVDWVVTAEL